MTDKLSAIRKYSEIWADSLDIPSSLPFSPVGATSNPVIVLANLQLPHNLPHVKNAIASVLKDLPNASRDEQVTHAVLRTQVSLGVAMASKITGLVNTQVDCRFANDEARIISQSQTIIKYYGEAGIPKNRVAIKIPSTWQGLQAAHKLTQEGINCNMTTMFSLVQAITAAEAGVLIISPYLNRLSAHFDPSVNPVPLPAHEHKDLPFVLEIYNYYKQNDIKTITLGASIVHVEEVDLIAGLDAITIFPPVLEKLVKREGTVTPLFSVSNAKKAAPIPSASYLGSEASFSQALKEDTRAEEYLAEALRTFQEFDAKLYKFVEDQF